MSHRQFRVFFLSVLAFIFLAGPAALAQPFISSLSPPSATAGGSQFDLTVNGSGFDSLARVHWNGDSSRPTLFLGSSQLRITVSANDIAGPGTVEIFVRNSPPSGPVSNTVIFSILSQNPVPTISSISPSSAQAGGQGFIIFVNGTGFVSGSRVRWNGSSRNTVFMSSTQIRADILNSDIANSGTAQVSVFNPTPGGGTSNDHPFTIGAGAVAQLDASPGALTFQGLAGGSNPPAQFLRVGNTGGGTLNFTATMATMSGGNWLNLSPSSGTASSTNPSRIQVNAVLGSLPAGLYSGTITVRNSSGGNPIVVNVFFKVLPATPSLWLSQSGLTFVGAQGDEATPPQSFNIVNVGQGTLSWTLQTIFSGTAPNWLTLSQSSGSQSPTSPSGVVNVTANPRSMAPGTYYAEIRVNAAGTNNAPQSVIVVLNVQAAGANTGAQVSPLGLIFVATQGGSTPPAQTVTFASAFSGLTAIVTASTTSGGTWLDTERTVAFTASGTPQSVRAGAGSLSPGVYQGTLNIAISDRTTQTVNVILVVIAPPEANPADAKPGGFQLLRGGSAAPCVPTKLLGLTRLLGGGFTSPVGWPRTIEVVSVDDCGNPANNATVISSFSNGDAPLVLPGIGNGVYTATWKPGSSADTTTVTIRINLASLTEAVITVPGKVSANPTVPQVGSGGVVNGASFAKGQPLAPGSIFSVFGTAMASTTPGGATVVPLPTTLAGASLVVGGITVPLYYSSAGQINAQIPFELAANTQPQVVVRLSLPGNTAFTVPESIALDAARPGIFIANTQGQGAITDAIGRLVDGTTPAAIGDVVVVYATGLGATNPAAETGKASPGGPLAVAVVQPTATVGGLPAVVHFAGLTPGFVGLYQVNVQIPSGVTPGSAVPVVITQNGIASNSVTIAVR